jgi:glycosyltransferase involved in cell wall biosynthesis
MSNLKNILFLTKYDNLAASSRLRAYQYQNKIPLSICKVDVQPLLSNRYLEKKFSGIPVSGFYLFYLFIRRLFFLFKVNRYDVIIVHIELFPFIPPVFEWLLFKAKSKVYLDYDDAIFHTYELSENFYIKLFLSNKIKYLMQEADGVICCNKYIEEYARNSQAKKTLVLPTVIDLYKYAPKPIDTKQEEGFTIGWIGSPSTAKYLEIVKESLSKLGQIEPVILYLVGAGNNKICIENVHVISVPWSEKNEQIALGKFDLGIMPLYNESWDKGKCAFKLIQYMASFLPVIASNVGMNSEVVSNGENGFLAENSDEWFNALYELHHNYELRKLMGEKGRALTISRFTIQAKISDFLQFVGR